MEPKSKQSENETETPEIMSIRNVAAILEVSESKVYQLCATRKLGHLRIDGCLRITAEQFKTYLDAITQTPAEKTMTMT